MLDIGISTTDFMTTMGPATGIPAEHVFFFAIKMIDNIFGKFYW